MKINEIETMAEFDKAVSGSGINIFKIGAQWCGPCKMLASVIEKMDDVDGVNVYGIDADSDCGVEVCEKFSVMSIPLCLAYKDGEMVTKQVGNMTSEGFNKFIQDLK